MYKHSSAWKIWVRMKWEVGTLAIEVVDDGSRGNDLKEIIDALEDKINTLRIRTEAIGATLEYRLAGAGIRARLILKTGS